MTLDEIRERVDELAPYKTLAERDREQLLAWLDAALPYVQSHGMFDDAQKLLAQMGVKP